MVESDIPSVIFTYACCLGFNSVNNLHYKTQHNQLFIRFHMGCLNNKRFISKLPSNLFCSPKFLATQSTVWCSRLKFIFSTCILKQISPTWNKTLKIKYCGYTKKICFRQNFQYIPLKHHLSRGLDFLSILSKKLRSVWARALTYCMTTQFSLSPSLL